MSLEAQFLNAAAAESAERGERVRFAEALAVFEDMHRTLKSRLAETPEQRALDGLDAVLALVSPSGQRSGRHLDLDGFAAFRGSVELLHDNTPESRALHLFEGALRAMIASASDFDDLPDADEESEAAPRDDDNIETAGTDEAAPVFVAVFEAGDTPTDDEGSAGETAAGGESGHPSSVHADDSAGGPDVELGTAHTRESDAAADDAGETAVTDEAADGDPAEIQERIEQLEAELAAVRANQAA